MSFLLFLKFAIGSIAVYLLFFRKKKSILKDNRTPETPTVIISYDLPTGPLPLHLPMGEETRFETPDSFGYKTAWLAIADTTPEAVIQAFGFKETHPVYHNAGLQFVEEQRFSNGQEPYVFVTPVIEGYVFVIGNRLLDKALPTPDENPNHNVITFFQELTQDFQNFSFFFSYRVSDGYAWGRVLDSHIQRIMMYFDGEASFEYGDLTPEEIALNLDPHAPHPDDFFNVDEDHVIELAKRWSFDPTAIRDLPPLTDPGYVCRLPWYDVLGSSK